MLPSFFYPSDTPTTHPLPAPSPCYIPPHLEFLAAIVPWPAASSISGSSRDFARQATPETTSFPPSHTSAPLHPFDSAGFASGATRAALHARLVQLGRFSPQYVAVICNSLRELVDQCPPLSTASPVRTPAHAVNDITLKGRVLVLAAGEAWSRQLIQPREATTTYLAGADQSDLLALVNAVRASGPSELASRVLLSRVQEWTKQGFIYVVLGCTELSALVPDSVFTAPRGGGGR